MTFLFWNIYKRQLQESILRIVNLHFVDIVILAECTINPALLLATLNSHQSSFHYAPSQGCKKIQIFTRFSNDLMPPIVESDRITIRRLKTSTMSRDVLVAALHFQSKSYWSELDQLSASRDYLDLIKQAEEQVGHKRTILIGDFNMNPYEEAMVNATGFNAVMSRSIAKKQERTIQRKSYPFFYNPMWSLSGDISPGPPGTYYFHPSGYSSYYWHIFDQLLIRPDLLEFFDHNTLKVVDTDGEKSLLLDNGTPDKFQTSDHLPLLFQIELTFTFW